MSDGQEDDVQDQQTPDEDETSDFQELLDGLVDALDDLADSDASDQERTQQAQQMLSDFIEEAQNRLSGQDNDEGEEDDTEDAEKQALGLVEAKDARLRERLEEALARVRRGGNKERKGMAMSTGTEDKGLDAKSAKAVLERLEALESEKAEREMESKAAQEAAKIAEREEQEAREKAAKDAEDQKRFSDMVAKALDTYRQQQTTGRKFVMPNTAGPATAGRQGDDDAPRYKSMTGWLRDLSASRKGDSKAYERIEKTQSKSAEFYATSEDGEIDQKALQETTSSAGGYLVPPQYWQQGIAEFRLAAAKVRQLVTVVQVNSNLVYIPRETGISTVGWTAENAAKPSTDPLFGQIAVNIFTLAGISKVSNQLLTDSSPAVDQIVRKDLGRVLGQAEDIAFINGSGTGQPTGILNTTGVLTVAYSSLAAGSGLGDSISAAINAVDSNFFGLPTAILAHPRIIAKLRQVKDTSGKYIFEPGYFPLNSPTGGGAGSFLAAGAGNLPGMTPTVGVANNLGPVGSVWGLPIYSDANIPTNLGGGTNESPMIIGVWEEAYLLERAGVTLDVSNEAGTSFEQNQTWFRGEERLGFTASRQPTAFCYVTGLTSAITN